MSNRPKENKLEEQFNFRMTPEEKSRLEKLASSMRRSMGDTLRILLDDAYKTIQPAEKE